MRIWISGPHLGSAHTSLWSWSSRRRPARVYVVQQRPLRPARKRRWPWVLLILIAAGSIIRACEAVPWLGILFTVAVGVILALGARGLIAGRRQTPGRAVTADAPPPASWKAGHVPASAEYKKAHPGGEHAS